MTNKMNPAVKEKWVSWLRENHDKQCQGVLRNRDNFCVLGGLCQVYMTETGHGRWAFSEQFVLDGENLSGELHPEIMRWAGVGSPLGPLLTVKGMTSVISRLNDGVEDIPIHPCNFLELADAIDEQL